MENEPCCICGQLTNPSAGNPGLWPILFGHEGGEGKTFTHCGDCCAKMYAELQRVREERDAHLAVCDRLRTENERLNEAVKSFAMILDGAYS